MHITPTRVVLLIVVASAVGAVVALSVARQRMAGVSEEEIRAYLDAKLASRLPEEQLAKFQDAAVKVTGRLVPEEQEPSGNGGATVTG